MQIEYYPKTGRIVLTSDTEEEDKELAQAVREMSDDGKGIGSRTIR